MSNFQSSSQTLNLSTFMIATQFSIWPGIRQFQITYSVIMMHALKTSVKSKSLSKLRFLSYAGLKTIKGLKYLSHPWTYIKPEFWSYCTYNASFRVYCYERRNIFLLPFKVMLNRFERFFWFVITCLQKSENHWLFYT